MPRLAVVLVSLLGACTALPDGDVPFRGEGRDAGGMDARVSEAGPPEAGGPDATLDGGVDGGAPDAEPCVAADYYPDCDEDGVGAVGSEPVASDCGPPLDAPSGCDVGGWSQNADDCDDVNRDRFPGAPEVCDGVDNDCDGEADDMEAASSCIAAGSAFCVEGLRCEVGCPPDSHLDCGGWPGQCVKLNTLAHCSGCDDRCALTCADRRCEPPVGIVSRGTWTCAWRGRRAACWGTRDGVLVATPEGLPIEFDSEVRSIAIGDDHQCALLIGPADSVSEVWCWGGNGSGQLGLGDTDSREEPTLVEFTDDDVEQVVAGDHFTCALTREGTVFEQAVWCWGDNRGLLVDTASEADAIHVPTPRTESAVGLTAGPNYACSWRGDAFTCWGAVPGAVPPGPTTIDGLRRAAAGAGHVCVVSGESEVAEIRCFGANDSGQLGAAPDSDTMFLMQTLDGETVAIEAGADHTCLVQRLTGSGTTEVSVWCFGAGDAGQLGGTTDAPFMREAVTAGGRVGSLALGSQHTCYLTANGEVSCWGSNDAGQLGVAAASGGPAPVSPTF